MPALATGKKAPDFILPTVEGVRFSLSGALKRGPVIAVFFKISCPVCQYAVPFVERIHQAYGGKATVVGISQNTRQDTLVFMRQYGASFPVLLDDPSKYPVSNAYGITNVPTTFLIAADGEIELSSVGWSKRDFETIAAHAAKTSGGTAAAIFHPSEEIAEFRAG
jgi:cytochrome c biogenesis protein CcmG, thiol:disulfide interchange protein DsbE